MRQHDRGNLSRVASIVVSLAAVILACAAAASYAGEESPGADGWSGTGKASGASYLYGKAATIETPTIIGTAYETVDGVVVPKASSFVDTLTIIRDFNIDGTSPARGDFPASVPGDADAREGGDFAVFHQLELTYVGVGPDTCWVRLYDDLGTLIHTITAYSRKSAGTDTVRDLFVYKWQYYKASFYPGKASSDGTWSMEAYARSPRR